MKRILFLTVAVIFFHPIVAQTTISIAADKTTSLIFPFPVLHADRGTKDILVQAVRERDNILLVKAGTKNFSPTNLSVLIADGSLYSFMLCYDNSPAALVYEIPPQLKGSVQMYANGILDNKKSIGGIKDKSWEMISRVTGIYIKDNVIYYQLLLTNRSSINYDIEFLRFYIRDIKKSKRTASQENELKPLYISGNTKVVGGNSSHAVVVALEKFTVPDKKFLAIEIGEKNGGRNLMMKVKNNKIIRSLPLPDLQ